MQMMQCYSHVAQLRQPGSTHSIALMPNHNSIPGHNQWWAPHVRGCNAPGARNAMHYLVPPSTIDQQESACIRIPEQYKKHDTEMRERHKNQLMLPPACYCPLSNKVLIDAVILKGDEISYDRVAIEEYLRNTKSCSVSPANPKIKLKHGKHAKQLIKNKTLCELVRRLVEI